MLFISLSLRVQDGLHQPGHGLLPYADFSVSVPEADLERLDTILTAIPPERARVRAATIRMHTSMPRCILAADCYS